MNSIAISQNEVQTGIISPDNLQRAVQALRIDGFVVLEDVIEISHLELLRSRMLEDIDAIMSLADIPFQFIQGHIQQDPPPFPPYLFRDVLANELVVAVNKEILGVGLNNTFYSGNTNLPGSREQPVHADRGQLWPNMDAAHPAASLVVNVPVVDMDASNGSTEIWPGTHLDTTVFVQDGDIKVPIDVLEKRRSEVPPIQPKVRRGSVLIRDIRLWHRGVTNRSDSPRPMIAMIHNVSWLGHGDHLTFPKGTEALFQNSPLHTKAIFVDGEIDYLSRNESYDFMK